MSEIANKTHNMYTSNIKYEKPPEFNGKFVDINYNDFCDQKLFKNSLLLKRANDIFDHKFYENTCPPEAIKAANYNVPTNEVYVLRLLIKMPGTYIKLPEELAWAAGFVKDCFFLEKIFPNYQNRFWYLTIRSGNSENNEAKCFHVDGFQGAKLPRHIPQQSLIWTNKYPTQWSIQPFFLRALDKNKDNIHLAFDKLAHKDFIYTGLENMLYMFDPYCVHRKDPQANGFRTLLRMTVSPVVIEDDTNTANPAFEMKKFNNFDPRNYLQECGDEVFTKSLQLANLRK